MISAVTSTLPVPAPRPLGAALCGALLVAVLLGLCVSAARAVILPAETIDGPSEEIVGFGGVAMAEDGTGGLVYLKRVDGVAHVFVSRYVGGRWLAPIRVDTEEPFAASWPRIGAANGGELEVVWATPFATLASQHDRPVDELLGATLGPGSTQFSPATLVDKNVGEAAGLSPDLAMSATGQADVVYRVVSTFQPGESSPIPLLRPGDVVEEVRVAHFDQNRWSDLGPINRDPGVSMRPPSASNAPKIAIGPTGNGVVVWQEPEIEGVARIWARRIYGTSLDYVMPVSAPSLDGSPIEDDADGPDVAFSQLGQAEVAYRQGAGPGSPLPGPRVLLNILPDGESESGSEFKGASVVDNEVSGGRSATVGPPSVDIDEQRDVRLLYDSNGTPRVIEGTGTGLAPAFSLGAPFAGPEPLAASVMNPEGGGVSAWPSADPQGDPAVAVREDFPDGAVQTALVSGGAGGEVSELAVGRSGLGDGLVAFRQGQLGDAAIVATQVSAPPVAALMSTPKGWIKPAAAVISWLPAISADGPLSYAVVLDGRAVPAPAGAFSLRLDPRGLGPGHHTVQVLSTDRDGGSTLSAPAALLIDDAPPSVKIARTAHGHAVQVLVRDAYSGLATKSVSVSFGDGATAHGRARLTHRYAHAGVYRVIVRARDNLGISGTVSQWVSVS